MAADKSYTLLPGDSGLIWEPSENPSSKVSTFVIPSPLDEDCCDVGTAKPVYDGTTLRWFELSIGFTLDPAPSFSTYLGYFPQFIMYKEGTTTGSLDYPFTGLSAPLITDYPAGYNVNWSGIVGPNSGVGLIQFNFHFNVNEFPYDRIGVFLARGNSPFGPFLKPTMQVFVTDLTLTGIHSPCEIVPEKSVIEIPSDAASYSFDAMAQEIVKRYNRAFPQQIIAPLCTFEASSPDGWIAITSGEITTTGSVTFDVDANPTIGVTRIGTIVLTQTCEPFSSVTVLVWQSGSSEGNPPTGQSDRIGLDLHKGVLAIGWIKDGALKVSVNRSYRKHIGDGSQGWEEPVELESAGASNLGLGFLENGYLSVTYDREE